MQTAAGAQSNFSCTHDSTYCSRDKHLARRDINEKKWNETIFLPRLICLLRNESVSIYYELQKDENSAQWNKLMTYLQYMAQSCRKENNVCQPHNNNTHQLCKSDVITLSENIAIFVIIILLYRVGPLSSTDFTMPISVLGPPLWSSGQGFWLHIQRSRVRFPALPDFLSGSGSGTGCTQPREPREVNWGATWIK